MPGRLLNALLLAAALAAVPGAAGAQRLAAASPDSPAGRALVELLRAGALVLGGAVAGRALPEGAALVIEPGADGPRPLGILAPVPLVGDGFHD